MFRKILRALLPLALVHRLRDWADAVLSTAEAAPQALAPQAAEPEAGALPGPRRTPPAHWVARVRKAAPQLFESTEPEASAPPAAAGAEPLARAAVTPIPEASMPPAPALEPVPGTSEMKPALEPVPGTEETRLAPEPGTGEMRLDPEPVPGTSEMAATGEAPPQTNPSCPDEAMDDMDDMDASLPHRVHEVHEVHEVHAHARQDAPFQTRLSPRDVGEPAQPGRWPAWHPEGATALPRPPPGARQHGGASGFEAPSFPDLPRPEVLESGLPASPPALWPELPEESPPSAADPAAVLRSWERLRRLDREQRGEPWNM